MRLTAEVGKLAPLLSEVNKVALTRGTIPILGFMLIEVKGDALRVTCNNMDLQLSAEMRITSSENGRLCVAADPVARFIGSLPPGALLGVERGDGTVKLYAGRARANFPTLDPETFPIFSAREPKYAFTIAGDKLADLLSVAFAASTEQTRPQLCGVNLRIANTEDGLVLRAEATNGHRLAAHDIAPPMGSEHFGNATIPNGTIRSLLSLCDEDAVSVAIGESSFSVDAPSGRRLISKLIDSTFPDCDRATPAPVNAPLLIHSAPLVAAIKRTSIAAESTLNRGRGMAIDLDDGALRVSGGSPGTSDGDAEETLDASYSGPSLRIGVNSRYLIDALNGLGGDEVEIHARGDGSPVLLRNPASTARRAVIMPMRV